MKILMFNNEFPPLGGGTGTVNKEILHQFAKKNGFYIDLFTSEIGKSFEIVQFSDRIRLLKVPVNNQNIHHSTGKELISYTIQAFFKAVKYHKTEKYQAAMAWATVPAGWNAFLMNKLFGIPYLVRVSGPDIPYFEERYNKIYPILTPIIKTIWSGSKKIIAKCQLEKELVQKYDKNTPIDLVYNAIDIQKFEVNPLRSFEQNLEIVCVARLVKRKGQESLMRALKLLSQKNIHFYLNLVGTGDDEQELKALSKNLGLEQYITFSGYVPREKVKDHYDKAQIFALPSFNEGMSNALLESMACGLPILVTQTGGTDELVKQGQEGYIFEAGNVQEAADFLEKMYQDRNLLKKMSENARKVAEKNSWENIAQQYEQIFREIAR